MLGRYRLELSQYALGRKKAGTLTPHMKREVAKVIGVFSKCGIPLHRTPESPAAAWWSRTKYLDTSAAQAGLAEAYLIGSPRFRREQYSVVP